jgi:hypothetical protein
MPWSQGPTYHSCKSIYHTKPHLRPNEAPNDKINVFKCVGHSAAELQQM